MSTLLQTPLFRYGVGIAEAALLVGVAFVALDPGVVRTAVLVVAGTALVTTPWVLGKVAEQAQDRPAGP